MGGTKRRFDGKTYDLTDAFPTKTGARGSAQDLRAQGDRARVVDLGPKAGRLRYGVYSRDKRRR